MTFDAALEGFEDGPVPNAEQEAALRALDSGKNIFLTGVAGTGKSWVLNRYLEKRGRSGVAVTASTGIAATHIGGQTIHAWSGCGIAEKKAAEIANGWWWKENIAPVIEATDLLIIEEISMLDGVTFELVGELCRRAKRQPIGVPFGGLQVILVGDMGQLAPVQAEDRGFPFETDLWWDLKIETIELKQVMRQRDAAFVKALQEIRAGKMSDETKDLISSRIRVFDPEKEEAVRVMTHNDQVDKVNNDRLRRLPGNELVFEAQETGEPKALEILDRNCLSPKRLVLKENARVMFTKNADGYVNGTMGHVMGVEKDQYTGEDIIRVLIDGWNHPIRVYRKEWKSTGTKVDRRTKATFDTVLARRVQFPLRLAWAVTAHKVQGMTLDKVSVNLANCFAPGQAYVALSRAKTLEGLNVEQWKGDASIIYHPLVADFVNGTYQLPPPAPEAPAEEQMSMKFDAE